MEDNLEQNCVPVGIMDMGIDQYDSFLQERRKLMALKIKDYYYSL